MARTTYSKGDLVRLTTNNQSYAKHPSEQRDLKIGDIVEVYDWDNEDEAIIFKIDYSPDNEGGKIWLCLDGVELVKDLSYTVDDCICDRMELMRVGCICGAIVRYKDK